MEIVFGIIGLLVGGAAAYFIAAARLGPVSTARKEEAEREAEGILADARRRADEIVAQAQEQLKRAEARAQQLTREAKEDASRRRKEADREIQRRGQEMDKREQQFNAEMDRREQAFVKSEEKLAEQLDKIDKRRQELENRAANLDKREKGIGDVEAKLQAELEKVASLDGDTARQMVLERVEETSRYEAAQLRKGIEDQARSEANEVARKLIVKSVFRCAVDHYSDSLISTVELKSDELKGRIIGREGRNIRAIEAATGVDVIIDDTPNMVVLSSFDGVRREIARQSLERLIQDGRIHPGKIEEIVDASREAVEDEIWRAGQEATFRTGVTGLHPELIKLLGKLKFRTSYGQNVLAHSIEVAVLSGIIASELGLNPKLAKRGGLLHDMGKGADPEMEGSHPEVGGVLGRKYGEHPVVVNCIEAHHGDIEQTIEAAIVQVADAISAVRPGARGEALQSYLQRLTQLEKLAQEFAGVEKAFAISAGRELRVLVKPDEMDDVLTYDLCRRITKRIEDDMEYPGTIKVTVIRETREVGVAK
jgi:ribonuclease Y